MATKRNHTLWRRLRVLPALLVLVLGPAVLISARADILYPPTPGLIYDVAGQNYIRPENLRQEVGDARYILLGETHDNPIHHQRQADLVNLLSQNGKHRAVVWEMINRDRQKALDIAWAEGGPEKLGPNLDWSESGWPSWQDYAPIAEAAANHKLPMVAGNLPADLLRPMIRHGRDVLPPALAQKLDLPAIPANIAALFNTEIARSHCGMLPTDMIPAFGEVQFARDASLARAMVDAAQTGGVDGAFLIAGAMHTRGNVGVPWHLRRFDPEGRIVVVTMIEIGTPPPGAEAEPAEAYLQQFGPGKSSDFIWFTSSLERGDPCDDLRMPDVKHDSKDTAKPSSPVDEMPVDTD